MSENAATTDVERRGSMCADCESVRGNAISNTIASGQQTITYRCPSCGRTWQELRRSRAESLLAPLADS